MQRVYLENKQTDLESKNSFDVDLTPSPDVHQKKDENSKKQLQKRSKYA